MPRGTSCISSRCRKGMDRCARPWRRSPPAAGRPTRRRRRLQRRQLLLLLPLDVAREVLHRALRGLPLLLGGIGTLGLVVLVLLFLHPLRDTASRGRAPCVTCRKNRYRTVSSSMRSIMAVNSSYDSFLYSTSGSFWPYARLPMPCFSSSIDSRWSFHWLSMTCSMTMRSVWRIMSAPTRSSFSWYFSLQPVEDRVRSSPDDSGCQIVQISILSPNWLRMSLRSVARSQVSGCLSSGQRMSMNCSTMPRTISMTRSF